MGDGANGIPTAVKGKNPAKTKRKLSFVLLVALNELERPLRNIPSWRYSPNKEVLLRTALLLKSFVKQFNPDDLQDFIVICPDSDIAALSEMSTGILRDCRHRILSDWKTFPEIAQSVNAAHVNGWVTQQLIKLAVAKYVTSEYYVTLDSDILCVKPFSYASLVPGGKALANVETVANYQRLYTDEFWPREWSIKSGRYQKSAEILGYYRPHTISWFYGETPCVLHTKSAISLTEELDKRRQQSWTRLLTSNSGWTEYSLYFQFLEMTGHLESVHALTGCNGILDLEKSVWQDSKHYRHPRRYDANHFLEDRLDAASGSFVAIQSWLPVSAWLPPRCKTLSDFYKEVEGWLLNAPD